MKLIAALQKKIWNMIQNKAVKEMFWRQMLIVANSDISRRQVIYLTEEAETLSRYFRLLQYKNWNL